MNRRLVLALLVVMAAAVAADAALSLHRARGVAARADGGPRKPLAAGIALDKALPRLALVDEHGRAVSLAALRGRYVVLAPTLTLCHEVCPLTTAALEGVVAAVRARGLQRRVTVAEVSVDPWRDSPARLRAFKRRTATRLALFTGGRAELRRFWRAFGVRFERTRGEAGARDWWTGRRLRFDVSHTDGVFILDPRGRLRVFVGGMPGVGRLPARLAGLLNAEGRRNLRRPESPWNVSDVVDDLWSVMGLAAPRPATGTEDRDARQSPALAALRADGGRLLAGGAPALRRRLAALRGRPVVINAWASWCPPCRSELPLFATAAARFGGEVAFLGLDVSDDVRRARAFLRAHRVPYPSYADGDGAAARVLGGLQGVPTTAFVDRRGRVAYVHTGEYARLETLQEDVAVHALGAPAVPSPSGR